MSAHVAVLIGGRASQVRCGECDLVEDYPRTKPAQEAARTHNRTEHPPEQPPGIDTEEA
jgi:DNA-directed RNA polymerase subunit K/omega